MNKNIYINDLLHRFSGYSFTETTVGNITTVTFLDAGSATIAKATGLKVIDAYRKIRLEVLNGETPIFLSTTIQRDALTNVNISTTIDNITKEYIERYNGTLWENIAGTGASVRLFTTAGQSLASDLWVTVNWASENHNTQNMHDNVTNNSRITIPAERGGRYIVTASLSFGGNVTGNRGIRLQKNGAGQERRVLVPNAGLEFFITVSINDIFDFVDGDYLEIAGWQASGAGLVLLTGADRNHFALEKLS